MHCRRAYALLLLFMSGAAAKKAKRMQQSIIIRKRGRNATLPQLIKPHVLGSNDAWKNAKKICDGGVPRAARPILVFVHVFKSAGTCVEINQCVGRTRQFFTKSFLGDDAAILARSSGGAPASPRRRAGVAPMAWRTTRRFSTNAP